MRPAGQDVSPAQNFASMIRPCTVVGILSYQVRNGSVCFDSLSPERQLILNVGPQKTKGPNGSRARDV